MLVLFRRTAQNPGCQCRGFRRSPVFPPCSKDTWDPSAFRKGTLHFL
jgi:hypothetical protein